MMHSKIAQYNFLIDAYSADFEGNATLPMIGNFMLKSATWHAEERGFGYSSMQHNNLAWVLSKMAIEIYEYPANDSTISIKTWVSSVNRLFTERCFSFFNGSGENIGYARTIWAAINIETRRPYNILAFDKLSDYIDENEKCPIEGMKKVAPIKNGISKSQFSIKYSDLDINKHLNSMKYIEHFLNLFDIEMFIKNEITRFEINYQTEGKYGQNIQLIEKVDSENIYLLEMMHEEMIISTSRITWKSKKIELNNKK